MELQDLIRPENILVNLNVSSKKQLLLELARHAAQFLENCDSTVYSDEEKSCERQLLDVLLERERLGSTGVGHGIAIPHGRLPGLKRIIAVFALLNKPVDYDSVDEEPVDIAFLLLAPEDSGADHLKALALVSRALRNQQLCERLRGCDNLDASYILLVGEPKQNAA